MDARTLLGRSCFAALSLGLALYSYEYSVTRAVRTAIESQAEVPKLGAAPSFDIAGCAVGAGLSGSTSFGQPGYVSSTQCSLDTPRPAPHKPAPPPAVQASNAEWLTPSLWFVAVALALPLGLGGVMAAVFWLVRER